MRLVLAVLLLLASSAGALAQTDSRPAQGRPVHTYSIVARDPNTGELGVAVQSHWFSVGPLWRGLKQESAR